MLRREAALQRIACGLKGVWITKEWIIPTEEKFVTKNL